MKKIFFAGLLVAVMGCASSDLISHTMYSDKQYAQTIPENVKIFEFLPPEIQDQYEPIGEIRGISREHSQLKKEAALMGGDIIVLKTTPRVVAINQFGGVVNHYDQSGIVLRRK